jgi:hypothetical protein
MAVDPSSLPVLAINLEHGDTTDDSCRVEPLKLFEQYTLPSLTYPGYGELEVNTSVLIIPNDIEQDWWGSPESYWMRQKVRRAIKMGYVFAPFEWDDYLDDIYEINTSKAERQGRPMTQAYRERPQPQGRMPEQPCPRHRNGFFGAFRDGRLYGYVLIVQSGEMMLFSKILGHGDHMEDGLMNLLVYEAVRWHHERSGTKYAVYYLHDSGTSGLQFFKRKMGFVGYVVRWQLGRRGRESPMFEPVHVSGTSG